MSEEEEIALIDQMLNNPTLYSIGTATTTVNPFITTSAAWVPYPNYQRINPATAQQQSALNQQKWEEELSQWIKKDCTPKPEPEFNFFTALNIIKP